MRLRLPYLREKLDEGKLDASMREHEILLAANANNQVVLNNLFANTPLETTFGDQGNFQIGIRCVSDASWVTASETAECVLALDATAVGRAVVGLGRLRRSVGLGRLRRP